VAKIVTNQQNYLIFGRRKTLCKSKITFNSRIVDRYIEFQKYMLLFDKSNKGLGLWCLTPLSKYFSYMVAVSFIGGGNRSTRRKPPTCRKSLTNFIR